MSYSLACGDVVEGCMTTLEAGSEDELMARVTDHARDEHGVTEISPELAGQVRARVSSTCAIFTDETMRRNGSEPTWRPSSSRTGP